MPLIAATPWPRTLPIFVHPESDLSTLVPFYVDGVERAGGAAVVVPWVATSEAAKEIIQRVDGLGVQWHPERLAANGHHVLFDWLVREAGR